MCRFFRKKWVGFESEARGSRRKTTVTSASPTDEQERQTPKQIQRSLSSHVHTSKVKKTILPTVAITLSKRGTRPPFHLLNYSHNKVTQKKGKGHPRSRNTPRLNCIKIRRKLSSQPDSKGLAAQVPSPFISLTTSLSFFCHSPSTVRERLCCCVGSTRELLWRCEVITS